MTARLDFRAAAPEMIEAMLELEKKVRASGIDHTLMHLMKVRASQINGCAFCVHMHTRDARSAGESEERLYLLSAWRDSPLYSPRERAALAWTEALTLLAQGPVSDEVYAELSQHFSEADRVKLSMVIVAINGWNRLCVGFAAQHPTSGGRAAA